MDAGAIVDGWHGDSARSCFVGDVPAAARRLVEATRAAMLAGIAAAVPGNTWGTSARAIEDIALAHGYGVVRSFVGHGIGTEMHEEPQVTNYRTGNRGRRIEPGLCLAIEPMFTLGGHEVRVKPDGWTVETRDGSLAAHWEHTHRGDRRGSAILTISGRRRRHRARAGGRRRVSRCRAHDRDRRRALADPWAVLVHSSFACRACPGAS